ncbi:class I adenylate-forming enzyme family protein [Haladaptatus sp. CMSO5]|uniref:class I adenylate-forming enzyme family protein n=1 Tax=Haladaptatus sp. CMSO5 TaxID=3120514 RepID=UPI002FCE124F
MTDATANMGNVFARTVARAPDHVGLVDADTGAQYTYGEWGAKVESLSSALSSLGIGPGDRVGAIMRNRAELATLYWATQYVGAVFVPLNYRAAPEEFHHLMETAEPRLLFFSGESRDVVEQTRGELDIETFIYVDADTPGFAIPYDVFVKIATDEFEPTWVPADADSIILHTSGTTGDPKGVRRSHFNTYAASVAQAYELGWRDGESVLGLMSLFHTMGFHTLTTAVLLNMTWVAQGSFSPKETLDAVTEEGIENLHMVPSVYHDLFMSDIIDEYDLDCVRRVSYGGMVMRDPIQEHIKAKIDPESFVNHYGSTEVYTHSVCRHSGHDRCAGKPGINTDVRIVHLRQNGDHDPDDEVPEGDLGEVIVDASSPETMVGYLGGAKPAIHDGWFFTGDLGYISAPGRIHVVGRVDDMILSGGENIYPVEVESTLGRHPNVHEVAVVGLEHEKWNQAIAAFVYVAEPPKSVDFEALAMELDTHCLESDSLADFKRPQKYVFVDEISKSNVGKLLRRELRKPDIDVTVFAEVTL